MEKAKCEIRERSHGLHVIITVPNGNTYRLSVSDSTDEITVLSDDGTIIIKPCVSNEIKITNTSKPPTP